MRIKAQYCLQFDSNVRFVVAAYTDTVYTILKTLTCGKRLQSHHMITRQLHPKPVLHEHGASPARSPGCVR